MCSVTVYIRVHCVIAEMKLCRVVTVKINYTDLRCVLFNETTDMSVLLLCLNYSVGCKAVKLE